MSTPSVYGPVFVATAVPGMWLAGTSALAARLYFQLLALLSVAAAMWLVDRWTNRSPLALAVIGLNPFVVTSVVNGAHNDATVGVCILAGIVLAQRKRLLWAGIVLAAAIAIKVAAGLCLVGLAGWVWRQRGWRPAIQLMGASALVTVALYAVGGGTIAVEPLQQASSQVSSGSIWYLAHGALTLVDGGAHAQAGYATQQAARIVSLAGSVVAIALTLLLVFRTRSKANPAIAVGLAVFSYGLIGAYVLPWYLAWAILPLALAWRSRSTIALLFFSAALHVGFVPDARAISLGEGSHGIVHGIQSVYIHWVVPFVEVGAVALAVVWTTSEGRDRLRARWPQLPAHSPH